MSQKASTILKPFSMVGSVVGKALSTVAGAAVNLGVKTASGLTKIMGLALKALMPAALVAAALAGNWTFVFSVRYPDRPDVVNGPD